MATTQHFAPSCTSTCTAAKPSPSPPPHSRADKPLPLPLLSEVVTARPTPSQPLPPLLALLWRLDEQENFSLRASLAAGSAAQAAE